MNNKIRLYIYCSFFLFSASIVEAALRRTVLRQHPTPSHAFKSILPLLSCQQRAAMSATTALRDFHSLGSTNKRDTVRATPLQTTLQTKVTPKALATAHYSTGSNITINEAIFDHSVLNVVYLLLQDRSNAIVYLNEQFPSPLFLAVHHYAIEEDSQIKKERAAIIFFLVVGGADVRLKRKDGTSILHDAVKYKLPETMLNLFLNNGANPHDPDRKYRTPFSLAYEAKDESIMTILTAKRGKKVDPPATALVKAEDAKPEAPKDSTLPPLVPEDPTNFETFADLAGDIPTEMRSVVEYVKSEDVRKRYERFGTKPYKGILFYGPPGTGKTAYMRATAKEAGVPFFYLKASDIKNKWVGGTEKRITHVFDCVQKHAAVHKSQTALVAFDEFDSFASNRDNLRESWQKGEVNAFLAEMDGLRPNSKSNVIVLAATNKKEELDKAAIRPGRFDTHIEVPLPDALKQHAILRLLLSKKPYEHNSSPQQKDVAIARILDLFKAHAVSPSPADLKGIVDESARRAAMAETIEFITDALVLGAAQKHLGRTAGKSIKDYVL